jgi:hypothetical protein
VDLHDQVPVGILHIFETDIPQDSCIVDEHIDTAKSLDCSLYYGLAVLDAVVVGNGASASSLDLVDDNICCLLYASQQVHPV